MKDQQINTFHKGMAKDISPNLIPEGSYIHADNIRILSDGESEESGIAVTVKGNKKIITLEYTVTQQDNYEFANGAYTPSASADLGEVPCTIIGYTIIRDTLVTFSIAEGTLSTLNTYFKTSVIHAIDLNNYEVRVILEHDELNFDTDYPIEAVGRYESEDTQRIYWTDNLNPVRTLNIKDVFGLYHNPPITAYNLIPSVNLATIKIKNILSGGSLLSGIYQYAYRLKSENGSETKFTIFTNPLPVVSGKDYWKYDEDPEAQSEVNGSDPGEETTKSVLLQVDDIDTSFDTIEFAAIYKTSKDSVADVYVFDVRSITGSSIEARHSSSIFEYTSGKYPILLEEATAFKMNISKAKTMATKDNRLFLGNIEETGTFLEFNSRAYRWKRGDSSENHYPYKPTDSVTTYVTSPDALEVIEEDIDAINPFNDLAANNLESEDKYKYQKGGIILGGEGPNIKYTFIKKKLSGDSLSGVDTDNSPFISGDFPEANGEGFAGIDVTPAGDFKGDYKSGVISANYTGYQRDEVYRFGIVLYDVHGNPGFVNWVGDIRFPAIDDIHIREGDSFSPAARGPEGTWNFSLSQTEYSESGNNYYYGSGGHTDFTNQEDSEYEQSTFKKAVNTQSGGADFTNPGDGSPGKHYLYALGIQFTVTIPEEIQDKVSGYSIVRTERLQPDKTVLAVGLLNYFHSFYLNSTNRLSGYNRDLVYSLEDNSTMHYGDQHTEIISIDTPEFIFSGEYPQVSSNDYLQMYGALSTGGEDNAFGTYGSDINYRKYLSHLTRNTRVPDIQPLFPLQRAEKLERGGIIISVEGPSWHEGTTVNSVFYNFSFENEYGSASPSTAVSMGIISTGEETLFAQVDMDIANIDGSSSLNDALSPMHWSHYLHYDGGTVDRGGSHSGNFKASDDKLLIAWRRDLGEAVNRTQYGGCTEEQRRNNTYISTGHFSNNLNSGKDQVFGGDTYVTFYDIEKTTFYDSANPGTGSGIGAHSNGEYYTKSSRSYSFAFPVETTINTALRKGFHYANKTSFSTETNNGTTVLNQFEYNNLYSAQNTVTVFIPNPDDDEEERTAEAFDSRVIYSDVKINEADQDNWRSFKLENYKDLDGNRGPITKLINFKDNLYFLQENGFGGLSINPTSTVLDQSGTSIVLGTGDVIQDFKYVSNAVGTSSQLSVISTEKGIYWIDTNSKKIYAFRADGLESISDIHGMKSWAFNNITKDTKLVTGHDTINNEVLFSIEGAQGNTLVFNEIINSFTSLYTYKTNLFINTHDKLLSVGDNNKLYLHNEGPYATWYEVNDNSQIEFVINKNPLEPKAFDTIVWSVDNKEGLFLDSTDDFDKAIFQVNSPNLPVIESIPSSEEYSMRENMSILHVPRNSNAERMRGTYMKVKLKSTKRPNDKIALNYVKTLFRISKR